MRKVKIFATVASVMLGFMFFATAQVMAATAEEDCGLRVFDGTAALQIACELSGSTTSPLQIIKNGVARGIILVDITDPDATPARIQTAAGLKALKALSTVFTCNGALPNGSTTVSCNKVATALGQNYTHDETCTQPCSYKCATGLVWDGTSQCVALTCGGRAPDGSTTVSCNKAATAVRQNYTHDETCTQPCSYKYGTKTNTCAAKPATGTAWNTVSSYAQTWDGSAWVPADDATTEYTTTASTKSCRYKCATGYTWNGNACVVSSPVESPGVSNCSSDSINEYDPSTWDNALIMEINTNLGTDKTMKIKFSNGAAGADGVAIVNWGDGRVCESDRTTWTGEMTMAHTYSSNGIYKIKIAGTIEGFHGAYYTHANRLTKIISWGNLPLVSLSSACSYTTNLTAIPTSIPSTVRDLGAMFWKSNYNGTDIGSWDVSLVTDMGGMFEDATSFNQPIGDWHPGYVKDMRSMFAGASSFNQPIGNWHLHSLQITNDMFQGAKAFNQDISNWEVDRVQFMNSMFNGASSFNQPIGAWDTSNVKDMHYMFGYTNAFNQPIGNWNTSRVTDMGYMFASASSFNQPIGAWDTSNVTDMGGMFHSATNFNQSIDGWDTSNVTTMSSVFMNADAFNQPLNSWDTAKVTSMGFMFYGSDKFNQPLDDWDTSNVASMYQMFRESKAFDQNLSSWIVNPKVTSCAGFSLGASASWASSEKPNFTSCTQ